MSGQSKTCGSGLFVIIPVHNRREITHKCLRCLAGQTWTRFRIIVINDGSTDGTGEMVHTEFPEVVLLQGNGNLWWTASVNMGVQEALKRGANYILTLNDDTEPPATFIEQMLKSAQSHPAALIGTSAISIKTGEIVYTGENINWLTARQMKVPLVKDRDEPLVPVTHFPGRGLLIPAQVFTDVGLYDQKHFPQMTADVDFTFRARRAGYPVYCHQGIRLPIHMELSTGGYYARNRSLKNYWRHLFSIKGGGNIKAFTYYALRNCPHRYLPIFLPVGLIRRLLGYWINRLARE